MISHPSGCPLSKNLRQQALMGIFENGMLAHCWQKNITDEAAMETVWRRFQN